MSDFVKAMLAKAGEQAGGQTIAWGEVTGTGPVTVRIAGSTTDITPADVSAHLTLTTNDKVVLFRVDGRWVVGLEV